MPLRRPRLLAVLGLCLLAAGAGASRPLTPAAAAEPPRSVPATIAGQALVQAAQPYLAVAGALQDDPQAFRGDGAVELFHLRYEQVLPTGLSAIVVQRVFQVRTAAAAELFALDDLWYDSSRSRFQLLQAQVLRHGAPALEGSDRGNLNQEGSGNQPRQVELPQLRAGDRISVLYLLLPDSSQDWSLLGGHFLGNLFAFRDSFPTLRTEYVLAAPSAVAAQLATSGVGVAPPRRAVSTGGLQTWTWEAEQQPAYFRPDDGASITDLSPFVQVSGFSSWAAMADWYNDLLARRAVMSPELQKKLLAVAPPLTPVAAGDPAAVRATVAKAWGYLAARLHYRGDEAGVHAYVPAPVGQVFDSNLGDCKDGALLLATWLRADGVEADVALVRTPIMGKLASGAADGNAAATLAAFDHALVYVPAIPEWIDTTAPGTVKAGLPLSDRNSVALIVRAGQRSLVRVPGAALAAYQLGELPITTLPASVK